MQFTLSNACVLDLWIKPDPIIYADFPFFNRSIVDFLYNLGCAWSHIGGLRFHLLLASSDLDPTMKYSIKYSLLEEKISSLELETKVYFLQ